MTDTTTAVQPVNWEAVRVLAVAIGVREAARQCGVSVEAAMKRSQREGWLSDPRLRAANQQMQITKRNMAVACPQGVSSPAAVMAAELVSLGQKTRISLARGIAKAGEHIESMDGQEILMDAQNVKSVAQTADLVHGWKDSAPQVKIRLDVLSGSADAQPIDIEATEIPNASAWDVENSVDPLDEY